VASASYTIIVPTPTFRLATGTYAGTQSVSINDAMAGATCDYSLTAGTASTTPTTSSTQYTGTISMSGTSVLESLCALTAARPEGARHRVGPRDLR
jgi:hypothetical protein